MYLSKLEILGFKSFADKINLNFKDGLSAIVGPNGSGKTNFVDALRWVLGEQKTSVLRSESMENVIFNGSKNRKPLGLSEVSISIKNTKKILPSEYDEINISRRLYRDGESQYLINKVPARLKDITGLFMDTGLGADSYSVIELKMIENLLNGNPADRRDIFEEAAGIKKFKQNKKETTKKLQNVELDLERLNDILQEVQKNVNSLARQASKTKRYNTLINEIKDLEIRLFAFEFLTFLKKLDTKRIDLDAALKKTDEIYHSISETEQFLNEQKKEFNFVDSNFQNLTKHEIELNNKLSSVNTEISLNQEKINSLDISQKQILNEIEQTEDYLEKSKNSLQLIYSEINQLKEKEESLIIEFSEIQSEGKNYQFEFLEKEKLVSELNTQINELRNRISNANSLISRNNLNKEKSSISLQEENKKLQLLEAQILQTNDDLKIKNTEYSNLKEKHSSLKIELEKLQNRKADSEAKIELLKLNELELKSKLQEKQNEIKFLEGVIVSDESTKFLINNKNWLVGEDKILLGEIISIDDKYRNALYAALNQAISVFLVSSLDDAEKGIAELRNSNQGIAQFISDNLIIDSQERFEFIPKDGIIGLLSDLVTIPQQYSDIVHRLTSNILVVEDFPTAKRISQNKKDFPKNLRIVTLTGELIDEFGIISGGGKAQNQKSQLLGKRNKIKRLESDITEILSQIQSVQRLITEESNSINLLILPEKEEEIKSLGSTLTSLEKEINIFEYKIETTNQAHIQIEESISKKKLDIEELGKEIISLENTIDEAKKILTDKLLFVEKEQKSFYEIKNNLEIWTQKSKSCEIELIRLQGEIKYKENEIKNLEFSIKGNENKINTKEAEFENGKLKKQSLAGNITEGLDSKQFLINNLQEIISEKDLISQSRKALQERITNYEVTLDNSRRNFSKSSEETHSIEIEIASTQTRIDSLQEITMDQYKIDLKELIERNQFTEDEISDFDINSAKTDIALQKEKISLLGNVNFQALEDYEEQKARLDFLLTQLTDLKNSQKLLLETIDEINKIAVEKFLTTFSEIRTNFQNLFKVLFGEEGEADLTLEGNSPLEASIGISAKPPFKKPSSIDLLSAGEKTLTAIALLFSIYLVKPSPFCILDEVDAPLDDTNIDKFISLIRKFSSERSIQFILITHNKKTMEAADTLYGLTMEEEGVTKVVSVRLDK